MNIRRTVTAARQEQGFTLIELLIVMGLLAIVLGALMVPMTSSLRIQQNDANYAYAQQEARTGLDSMVNQIRQATSIISSGPNFVEMNLSLQGTIWHVEYECDIAQSGTSYHECLRVQAAQGASLPAMSTGALVVKNLTNGTTSAPVFTWGPDPSSPYYMTATIDVSSSDGTNSSLNHTIAFSDGALMRNMNVGN